MPTKREQAKQDRRKSNASGPHQDRRTRRTRTRGAATRKALEGQR